MKYQIKIKDKQHFETLQKEYEMLGYKVRRQNGYAVVEQIGKKKK